MITPSFVVIGLDPGFHHFGWAVVSYEEENFHLNWPNLLDVGSFQKKNFVHSCVKIDETKNQNSYNYYKKKYGDHTLLGNLCYLYYEFQMLLEKYKPIGIVMEKIIIPSFKNPMSSVILGYARSMALLAIGQNSNIEYFWEIAPTTVKRYIGSHGNSSKEHLQHILKTRYNRDFSLDESDALAMACSVPFICQENI